MSCNEINLQEAFFLFSCQKRRKKKGILLHRHHKKLIFQIIPCSFQGCKFHLRWCSPSQCGLPLFLALRQDTGLDDLSAALTATYDLTLTDPASYLPWVVGLKASWGDTLPLFFFPSTNPSKLSCATHPVKSQVYCLTIWHTGEAANGDAEVQTRPRTFGRGNWGLRIPRRCCFSPNPHF